MTQIKIYSNDVKRFAIVNHISFEEAEKAMFDYDDCF